MGAIVNTSMMQVTWNYIGETPTAIDIVVNGYQLTQSPPNTFSASVDVSKFPNGIPLFFFLMGYWLMKIMLGLCTLHVVATGVTTPYALSYVEVSA